MRPLESYISLPYQQNGILISKFHPFLIEVFVELLGTVLVRTVFDRFKNAGG